MLKNHICAFILGGRTHLGLFGPKDEGTVILGNISNYL